MPPRFFAATRAASAALPLAAGPEISPAFPFPPIESPPMSPVPPLICNPANPALDSTVVDGARAILPSAGPAQWLFDEVAVDIPFTGGGGPRAVGNRLRGGGRQLPRDIVAQPDALRRQKRFLAGKGSPII